MAIRSNGRSMLIIAAGIWMCFSGPLQAVQSAEAASMQAAKTEDTAAAGKPIALNKLMKHANRSWKKHAWAQRKSRKIAWKSSHRNVAMADFLKMDDGDIPAALPADIGNANAKLASDDAPIAAAKVMSARADALTQTASQPDAVDGQTSDAADTSLVSSDQLNDVDRALAENNAPAPLLTMAAANTPVTIGYPVMASAEDSAWSKSSIIGKIFIFFGGLLTLASAARMFMA